jgi:hypothetical protein
MDQLGIGLLYAYRDRLLDIDRPPRTRRRLRRYTVRDTACSCAPSVNVAVATSRTRAGA